MKKGIRKIINRENIPSSKKLAVFSVFIIISSILWFLNALSENYNDYIEITYTYSNFPEDKGILGELPSKTKIEVNTTGFVLIKFKYLYHQPIINIDVNKSTEQKNGKLIFIDNNVKKIINNNIGNRIEIIQTGFANKTFKLSKLKTKYVPIKPLITINFAKQHRLTKDIVIFPNKIKVSGYKSVIDTITEVYTNKITINNLNTNKIITLELNKNSNLRYSNDSVKISIFTEKFTEKVIEIPIKIINNPNSVKINLLENNIKIKFNINVQNYDKIEASQFKAIIDYNKISKNNSNFADVNLVKYPKEIKKINYYPKKIKFFISNK